MNHLTVAVTGATGFVGRYLVRELLGAGHAVRALARDPEKARKVLPRDERVAIVRGSAPGAGDLARLVEGADACINLLGIIREGAGGQTFRRIHIQATEDTLAACHTAGVRRFVQMSALGVSDEGFSAYMRTKWEAELAVRRSGLDWTIFRPSTIHGPDGEFVQQVKGWALGKSPPYSFLPYFKRPVRDTTVPMGPTTYETPVMQPVSVLDVAAAFARAMSREEAVGEVYNLVGPDVLSWPEFLVTLRDAIPGASHAIKPRGVPGDLAALAAKAAGLVGLGRLLPFDEGMAKMGCEDSVAEEAKARVHLDLEPRPFRETVQEYAASI